VKKRVGIELLRKGFDWRWNVDCIVDIYGNLRLFMGQC